MTRARELSRLGNTNVISVDANQNVGINSTIPDAKLDVVGVVSATEYYGDGSNLTGITAGATLSAGSGAQRVVVTSLTSGTMTAAATDAELTYNSDTDTLSATTFSGALTGDASGSSGSCTGNAATATLASGLTGSPNITINNLVGVAATFTGVLTYEDVTNVDSIGIITARSGIQYGTAGVAGSITSSGDAVFVGIVTAAAYYGDASNLTNLPSAGLSTQANSASGITSTLYLSDAQDHKCTTTGFVTFTSSGGVEGESHTLRIISSGISTIGFGTYFLWPSGSPPSLNALADGSIQLISFTVNRVGTAGTQLLAGASLDFS